MQELGWVFGFSSNISSGVVDLRTSTCPKSVCYAAGHNFIIYDGNTHTQMILQGHVHQIQCLAAAPDKSCILTCDAGCDALLIQWDSKTGQAMKAVSQARTNGIIAVDVSSDGSFFATLSATVSADMLQELSIWDMVLGNEPLCTASVASDDLQICVRFNEADGGELITNGSTTVFFWRHLTTHNTSTHDHPSAASEAKGENKDVNHHHLEGAQAVLKPKELKCVPGSFTVSSFSPNPQIAYSGTVDGDAICWGEISESYPTTQGCYHSTQSSEQIPLNWVC
ncbi:unnamed protein product [Sphagnum tenellum]